MESKADARFFRRISALEQGRERSAPVPSISTLEDLATALTFAGHRYPSMNGTMPGSPYVEPSQGFVGLVQGVHRRHGIVAGAVIARALLLSQLHFQFRPRFGQSRQLFGSGELSILDSFPVPRPRTLMTMEMQASYAGNSYVVDWFKRGRLRLVAPESMTAVLGTTEDVDPNSADFQLLAEVVGWIYRPPGVQNAKPVLLPPECVAQWAPEPDPICWWRGESWVTSVVRDVATDFQISDHTNQFFTHAATPNLTVSFDAKLGSSQVEEYAELLAEKHAGSANAWRTLVLGGGADVQVVGSDLSKLAYKDVQGGLETRIGMRSRIPAPILGTREGMQGSALNAGNYTSARRMWSDGWFSPTADGLCAALDHLVPRPSGGPAELTYDPARVMFLQEDRKDEADILKANAEAMRQLVDAGYDADSVTQAVTSGDLSKLTHSGLFSVQLQEPGATQPA